MFTIASVIALRLADLVGASDRDREATYYLGLLMNVYCHADAAEQARWFGDDISFKGDGSRSSSPARATSRRTRSPRWSPSSSSRRSAELTDRPQRGAESTGIVAPCKDRAGSRRLRRDGAGTAEGKCDERGL